MHLLNLFRHEVVVTVSFFACVLGLILLWGGELQKDDVEETERILFRMSFSYWLVYCFAFGIEKLVLPHWEMLQMTLKITAALSYFLTFSCILSLPLHRFAARRVEE
ncbi:hypothetical protein [Fortiea contorta]|uniref:hypothetical protein n=1 Tax=Fortiea contorta TaxID=1892405 RepID=UPI0003468AA1|nr:hypothetical protein [Fortiea contorta]